MTQPILPVRADLACASARMGLPPRHEPYWTLLEFCRHLGYQKRGDGRTYWIARYRKKGGGYKQRRLGEADSGGPSDLSHEQAVVEARSWFNIPAVAKAASEAYPVGVRESLIFCPIGDTYTVGHALHDYVEWKRIAAAASHFQTNLSLINHHIAPRLASIPLAEFNGIHFREFARDVLETPPKRGNQRPRPRRPISQMDDEALRKRKKTLNALVGILRLAIQMAWENGRIDNERAWRCLRRVPNVERPRMLFLSRDECRRLLECCRPDLRQIVLGALYTGCRLTELLRLTVFDVARDGYGVYIVPIKNYRPRFVFLPDEGMAFFLTLCEGKDAREPVFARRDGRPWRNYQKRLFKDAVRAAGLPEAFTFHGLRHTYASQLVQSGAPLIVIAEQLGHANTTTVSRTYGHLAPQIRESEVRQRFKPLSPGSSEALTKVFPKLEELRRSFHGEEWREYAQIHASGSWPRSNFYRGDASLVEMVREAGKDRAGRSIEDNGGSAVE